MKEVKIWKLIRVDGRMTAQNGFGYNTGTHTYMHTFVRTYTHIMYKLHMCTCDMEDFELSGKIRSTREGVEKVMRLYVAVA